MARITRTATITFVTVMLIATTLGLVPGVTPTAEGTAEQTLSYSPAEGATGTAITVQGRDCFLADGTTGADGVVVVLETDSGDQLAATTVPVAADGTFTGELAVPAGAPAGTHRLHGTCVSPELPDLGVYAGGPFTVTGEGEGALTAEEAAAAAQPAAGGIEPYPRYDGQTTCSPPAKPATLAFAMLTLATFPNTGNYGISRACHIGGRSEHKEGRAWDWKANAANPAQHRSVDQMLNWLLATDAQGNRHALARRLGIMYIIWDRQMFRMYRVNDGWQPYTGSHPHTDHVHISFTRAGGNMATSFWGSRNPPVWGGAAPAPPPPPPSGPPVAAFRQTRRDIYGDYVPLPGDYDGDSRDDVLWYGPGGSPDYMWWGQPNGHFVGMQISVKQHFLPQVGDFDGDGSDDVIWYGAGARPDYVWWGGRDRRFRNQQIAIGGTYTPPVTGDFDGDGRDDVFWYAPGSARDWIWWGARNRRFVGGATSVVGTYSPPFSGDFDNDGRDDIYWYGRGRAPDYMWHGRSDRRFNGTTENVPQAAVPMVGNFNGDGHDDVFWHRAGPDADWTWLGAWWGFKFQGIQNVWGTYNRAFVADLDDNGRDDIYWYSGGPAADYIWWF